MTRPCPFCDILSAGAAGELVYDHAGVAAFLDRRPVFHGHTLVVPRRHIETLGELPTDLAGPLLAAVQVVMRALEEVVGAEGTFVATNNRVSQSVPHLHVHVVPRRRKDGLRGFFWPRHPYAGDEERRRLQRRLATTIQRMHDG